MGFGNPFESIGNAVVSAGKAAGDMAANAGKSVAEGAGAAAGAVGDATGNAAGAVGEAASNAGKAVVDGAGSAVGAVGRGASEAGRAVASAAVSAGTAAGEAAGNALQGAKDLVNGEAITGEQVEGILSTCYEKSLKGISGVSRSVQEMTNDYLSRSESVDEAVKELIRIQMVKCGTSGFVTSLGGVLTLPVAIPANIASVLYVQIRMIAAIAQMGGYDVETDQVQTMVYLCMVGNAAADIIKDAGIKIGNKVAQSAVQKIPGKALIAINKKVGFRLATKFGEKGIVNLGKVVPVAGGVIGGGFDAVSTKIVGDAAYKMFIKGQLPD